MSLSRFRRDPYTVAPASQPVYLQLPQASKAPSRFGPSYSALLHLRSGVLASADFYRPDEPPCSGSCPRGQDDRSPRVRRVTFIPYTRGIYGGLVRMTLGFGSVCPLAHQPTPLCPSCSSGRDFACSFLPIPPRGGHRCCSARGSCHGGPQRDLHPPRQFPARFRLPVLSTRLGASRHAWRTNNTPEQASCSGVRFADWRAQLSAWRLPRWRSSPARR